MQQTLKNYPSYIPLKHYQLDICDENALKKAFNSVTIVFHCAGKSLEYLHDGINHIDQYWCDNTNATEILLKVMHEQKISYLVYVSDAYANLPIGDNFGLSEQVHLGFPKNFMLGIYGESKIRAEMCVRKAAAKGQINALILRPTFIYGEGEKHLLNSALKLCAIYGGIPYLQDQNRGHHQFLYAGNMAAIMLRGMVCLKEDPERYNGEVVICMDCTPCTRFIDFMEPFLEAKGLKRISTSNYLQTHFMGIFYEILNKFAPKNSYGHLTLLANKFINCWSIGFSNRKLRLLLDFVPPYEQSEAVEQSLRWHRKNGQTFGNHNGIVKMK
ncbi:hypothetical protein LOAG_06809 [Loa loa]|uniref:3-beta hydroxysteroid dehydrogenase/isomerase domain-containing protein n=2 Tax=Loa loa TaxID=7209 RepID=A0A1S0TXD3_LOALO|nr:hypothetical protein LOAG_06809 [Loa loa]EFO21674.1 hypothetical protein LOAG_06809 [Loa loa]